jgi:hypothetical protein
LNWDNSLNKLYVTGDLSANNLIGNLNTSNITGVVPLNKGGTGISSLQNGQILFGGINSLSQTNKLNWDNSLNKLYVTGDLSANNLIGNLNASNITGVVPFNKGGTGISSLLKGPLLFGDTESLLQTNNLNWDNDLNKLYVTGDLSANNLIGNLNPNNITGIVPANKGGTGATSLDPNYFQVSNNILSLKLNASNINDIIPIEKGGSGLSSFKNGEILFGGKKTLLQTQNLSWDNETSKLQINGNINATDKLCVNNKCINSDTITNLLDIINNLKALPQIRLLGMRGSGNSLIDGGGLPPDTLGDGKKGNINTKFRFGIKSTLINDYISYAILDNNNNDAILYINKTSQPEVRVYFKTPFMNPFGTVSVLERMDKNGNWYIVNTKNITTSVTQINYYEGDTGDIDDKSYTTK